MSWISASIAILLPLNYAAAVPGLSRSFDTPAMKSVCEALVRAHPTRPSAWYVDPAVFAASESGVFALLGTSIVEVTPQKPAAYREVHRFGEMVRDLEFHRGKLWVLLDNKVLALDPISGAVLESIDSQLTPGPGDPSSRAHAMVWLGHQLVIAHGSRGISIYDSESRKLQTEALNTQQENGHRSKIIDVTAVDAKSILLAIDSVTLPNEHSRAFNGLAKVVLRSEGLSTEYAEYDLKHSGVLSNAVIKVEGDRVLVNNWGILQSASLGESFKMRTVRIKHHRLAAEILGEFYVEDGELLGCGKVATDDPVARKTTRKGIVLKLRPF